jgi:hypothetical protein
MSVYGPHPGTPSSLERHFEHEIPTEHLAEAKVGFCSRRAERGSRRLTIMLRQSRMSRIVSTPVYRYMTTRNWNTTRKLLALVDESA